jgi:predicted kinase
VLIVMAGRAGVGKSTLARALAQRLGIAVLPVDPIEAALWRAGIDRTQPTGLAAYVVADALAAEQLALGASVIVDAVNAVEPARQGWRQLAGRFGVPMPVLEVFCSDPRLHQTRLASRDRGLDASLEPTWEAVLAREYQPWPDRHLRLDSARPVVANAAVALEYLAGAAGGPVAT